MNSKIRFNWIDIWIFEILWSTAMLTGNFVYKHNCGIYVFDVILAVIRLNSAPCKTDVKHRWEYNSIRVIMMSKDRSAKRKNKTTRHNLWTINKKCVYHTMYLILQTILLKMQQIILHENTSWHEDQQRFEHGHSLQDDYRNSTTTICTSSSVRHMQSTITANYGREARQTMRHSLYFWWYGEWSMLG